MAWTGRQAFQIPEAFGSLATKFSCTLMGTRHGPMLAWSPNKPLQLTAFPRCR